ncbi:MAG: phosphoribosylformylglycinamidine synthase I [Rhodospirillaceae bacterium]|nr:phosphoribosylformylglycinamidine synthase I [Rhodospirillaceae bacterium]
MKAAVIVFPGSNCDRDIAVALEACMGHAPAMVWHRDSELPDVDLIALPGGFSYGDYLRSGAMAVHSPAMREVVARAERGVAVLGICNGFQVLTESGLLPGALMRNRDLRFVCRDVWVRVETTDSVFTTGLQKGECMRFPVAHNDGSYFVDDTTLATLQDADRIAFRYVTPDGQVTDDANPNGSRAGIAGVLGPSRNVLGMMPHPERLVDEAQGGTDGRRFFEGLLNALETAR